LNKSQWFQRFREEEFRPTVVCLNAALTFSLWHSYGSPKFYLQNLSSHLSFTGDAVIDAELYRGLGNVLVIVILVLMIKVWFRRSLVEHGLGIGQWRNAPFLVAATPVMLLFGYLAARMPEYQEFYPATPGLVGRSMTVFLLHVVVLVTYYVAWELMFRGYIQTSLLPRMGVSGAIAAQTLASTLAHTDRPSSELLGSIAAGIVWGIFAYRTKSVWPVFMHHLLLGLTLDYWICFGGVG
jgi:membrane protease YdiL (CAAX protease family)